MHKDEKALWDNVVLTLVSNYKPYRLEKSTDDDGNENISINAQAMEAITYCASSAVVARRNFDDRLAAIVDQAQREQAEQNDGEQ